jgi:hypothetical protein
MDPVGSRRANLPEELVEVLLMCDPIFSGLRNMSIRWSYIFFPLGRLPCETYIIDVRCDLTTSKLFYSHRWEEDQKPTMEFELDLYVDPGNNCLFPEQ